MRTVRIVKDYSYDLLKNSPMRLGVWGDVQFTEDKVDNCDYLIILNKVDYPFTVNVPPNNVWAVMQEPPITQFKSLHRSARCVRRVFTQDKDLKGKRFIHSQPALPWHIQKTYDELKQTHITEKNNLLSWITSNKSFLPGHRTRLGFVKEVKKISELHLYGRGFQFIEDKWDGLASYRYSLAVENFQNEFYWSEKVADCFLAWTMPIYYGCTRITEYFPSEALIQIDISDSKNALEKIREAIYSNSWQKNRDAIEEARRRVLDQHQLFPFLAQHIYEWEKEQASEAIPQEVYITNHLSWSEEMIYRTTPNIVKKVVGKVRKIASHVRL